MENLKLQELSEILLEVNRSGNGYVYVQGQPPWSLSSLAIIFPWDGYVELEEIYPELCKSHNLNPAMDIYEAQDVIQNARFQRKGLTMTELLLCFNHFAVNGAFLRLSENT
jgi:hypothetical protein